MLFVLSNRLSVSNCMCVLLCAVCVDEQSKVEQLAADWKALDGRLRESLQPPASPWTQQQQQLVQHQQLGKQMDFSTTQNT